MWQVRPSTIGALSAAALLALGACTGDGTAPRALVLSQAQADSLGEQLTLDAEDEIAGAAASGAASFGAVAAPVLSPSSSATVQCTPTRTPAISDRKSTRLNSSHTVISYAVSCLKKKTNGHPLPSTDR